MLKIIIIFVFYMNIPVTDKFWVKCKFDENFNEVSYIDNRGTSYEYIDPVKGHLKFYKNNNIYISQELLDNIHNIKSDDPDEQSFISSFSNLRLGYYFRMNRNYLFFRRKHDDKILVEYNTENNNILMTYYGIQLICDIPNMENTHQARKFMQIMFLKYFNIVIKNVS